MDDIDQFIVEATTRKSHRIDQNFTNHLRNSVLPIIKAHATIPEYLVIYGVQQKRGRAYCKERRITVPTWTARRFSERETDYQRKNAEYQIWYLSHEIAHVAQYLEDGYLDHHGPKFMKQLIRICPWPNALRFETGYKPRNATAAGISNIDSNDL